MISGNSAKVIDAVKLKLIREKQPAAEEKDNKPVFQLAAYLQQHLSEDITLQSLADEISHESILYQPAVQK